MLSVPCNADFAFNFYLQKLMEANYYSAVNATKASIDSMVEQQAGRVVFLSSQAGQIGLFGFSAYSASKFALRGLAEALQMEVRCCVVFCYHELKI
jgi:3-dehydrosphinganine reductase